MRREAAECLDPETLAAYVDGRLDHEAVRRVDRHVDTCRGCRGELSALAATHSFPDGSGEPGAASELPVPLPVLEGKLGRYEIQRELGRGSMGVVVRAYDPELARAVAVKVLEPRLWHGAGARERLRREAQAMARLSHPNVVTVHDVTSHGDSIAIAMELIDGETLRARIASGRSWQALLATCVLAGRGLAAAHAARLIHRDFKPENVLCATTGRVVVSDFGLARLDDETRELPAGTAATTSTFAGTPAYMAPELLRGQPATAASDQFSFCVTTWEALHGERPFGGDTLDALRDAIAAGVPRPAPVASKVPARIQRALRRGMAPDPARRFASMDELLAILAAQPWSWRRRGAVAGGLALVGITGAALAVAARGGAPACGLDVGGLAWDRVGLIAALRDQPAAAGRIAAGLDAYGRSWAAARHEACAATRERGELSERVLDARSACLDRGRRELDELVALIIHEPAVAGRAREAIEKLPDPASCTADVSPTPVSPELDRATVLLGASRLDEALGVVQRVIARGPEPATLAEALLLRGRIESSLGKLEIAETSLADAIPLAERAHADQLVAAIWVELVQTVGAQKHRFEAAQADMRAAEAAFARSDPGPALRTRYAYSVGTMYLAHGKLDEARAQLDRALAGAPEARPAERSAVQAALCDVDRQQRHFDAARAHCAEAIALLVPSLGPDHPRLGAVYNILGTLEYDAERTDAALARYGQAIALYDRAKIEDDRTLALALSNAGTAWMNKNDLARARPLFERARTLFATYHPDHPQRTLPLQGLAMLAYEAGDMRTSIRYFEETLAVIDTVYGKDSDQRTGVLFNLALAYQTAGDLAHAEQLLEEMRTQAEHPGREDWTMVAYALDLQATIVEGRRDLPRAITLRERALEAIAHADAPRLRAWLDGQLGTTLRRSGHTARALAPLERAVVYYTAHPEDRYQVALARFSLARALWDAGPDRRRAVALATAAAEDFAAAQSGLSLAAHRTEIATWLRQHRAP